MNKFINQKFINNYYLLSRLLVVSILLFTDCKVVQNAMQEPMQGGESVEPQVDSSVTQLLLEEEHEDTQESMQARPGMESNPSSSSSVPNPVEHGAVFGSSISTYYTKGYSNPYKKSAKDASSLPTSSSSASSQVKTQPEEKCNYPGTLITFLSVVGGTGTLFRVATLHFCGLS